ncbi:Methyl-accepting chemotaxis protein (MCP) signaling domain protein [compost metagenome]
MAEVTRATREQSTAATQITSAIHDMNRLTHQVHEATAQQAEGSSAILAATSDMARMTHQVSQATSEQQLAGDRVAKGFDAINGATHEATAATSEMAHSAVALQAQANELLEAIAFFEDAEPAPVARLGGSVVGEVRALSAGVSR